MAHQDEGWPLGLRPLNARVGLIGNRDFSAGSVSFSTFVTASPTSSTATSSSSDLDTQSTESFFHDKSITLGSLIGVSGILNLSRRSSRRRTVQSSKDKKHHKPKPWLFTLCSKLTTDSVDNVTHNTPSLGHFLEAERRASGNNNINRRDHGETIEHRPDDSSLAAPVPNTNRLFVDGVVAATQLSASENADGEAKPNRELIQYGNGFGTPLLLSCLCGQLIK